ncbi:hypothetical protein ACHQM5_020433 [Ranunculus cassubicifolius]
MAASHSVESVLRERKYPFIFSLFILLASVSLILFLATTRYTYPSSVLQNAPPRSKSQSKSKSKPHNQSPAPAVIENVIKAWEVCPFKSADYIPCLDNMKAIKALKSRRHMEHRERHCPIPGTPTCLIPLPPGYKTPLAWPRSRDMIWYDNVPHPKLVDYKKGQNWVQRSGNYFIFPGGGTQFKEGVTKYVDLIEETLPTIKWGKHTRVVLDVGCGVASFGGFLLDKNVLTMSFAPKDEHEAQIQFALERGIPATLSVIGTQRLAYPDNAFDLIHCARCRVHWDANGGKPLLELNRILRPGGLFVWSATPVYRNDTRDANVWNAMVVLTESICWKAVVKTVDSSGIGLVIYQKPVSNVCYKKRKENTPPLCDQKERQNTSWYVPLGSCLPTLSTTVCNWPPPWPERLTSKPQSLESSSVSEEIYYEDTKHWSVLVSEVYLDGLAINWSSIRNVMDMNAGYGGFAAALIDEAIWVMNVVPVNVAADTLPVIFDRGLIGIYHDWCESFNTYPRTYDLLHSNYLFQNLTSRCELVDVAIEMDRILRPGGWLVVQDKMEIMTKLASLLRSLHWETNFYQAQFLVARKGFWRPTLIGKGLR